MLLHFAIINPWPRISAIDNALRTEGRSMEDKPHWMQVLLLVLGELVFIVIAIPLYIFLVLPNHPVGSLPGIVPIAAPDTGFALTILYTLLALALPMALFFTLYRLFGDSQFSSQEMLDLARNYSMPDLGIVYIAAGISEEFLFRGALVEPCGVIISALLFTALHLAYWKKPLVLVYTFAIGLIWGFFYVLTESLLLCALVHAIYNFVVTGYIKYKVLPREA